MKCVEHTNYLFINLYYILSCWYFLCKGYDLVFCLHIYMYFEINYVRKYIKTLIHRWTTPKAHISVCFVRVCDSQLSCRAT